MTASVITVSRDELVARRDEILGNLGVSLAEFKRLVATGPLSGDEWEAREELEDIEFLLGETQA